MASIEYINKRIEGKTKEIEKLEKKMERILKAQATDWEVNPYYYGECDLKYTARDLENAKAALAKWQDELKTATEKSNSRNVKAILDFLEMWKQQVTKFYRAQFKTYPEALEQYHADHKPYEIGYFEERRMKRDRYDEWRRWQMEKTAIEERFKNSHGFLEVYISRKYNPETERYDLWEFDWERLEKDLTEEAARKYDNIIERTNKITGTIDDATALKVGKSGELDGYVIGEKGTAHVHTIGAGGYNIQCYHFRVLVHEVKAK